LDLSNGYGAVLLIRNGLRSVNRQKKKIASSNSKGRDSKKECELQDTIDELTITKA